jgi:hypothetical protein
VSEPRITFAELRGLMADLGLRQVAISDGQVAFVKRDTETVIPMPVYKDKQVVRPHHLASVRIMLDNAGILDPEGFDHRVASVVAKPSAS